MIQINNLIKVYKSKKKKKENYALNNINLTLPDKGLIFVLGKSGSGKSTLLNLIGGLDNITSGTIEVNGNDLTKFNEKDYCNYRNTYIGFIFQDYYLIDDLTVYENIVLSLNLCHEDDSNRVKEVLAKVNLSGYEDRYPNELSGGEKQRVAIARAIIKKPQIILADEPTGNLDSFTSSFIIKLLKELAQECLILIVSHNVNDANNYADRIIELKKGEIIRDNTKNIDFNEKVVIENNQLIYPSGTILSKNDVELINNHSELPIVIRNDKFLETKEVLFKVKKDNIISKKLIVKKELKLSGTFLKNKTLSITLSALMVSIIMIILSLAQTIVNFDANRVVANEMIENSQNSLLINKGISDEVAQIMDQNYHIEVDENDISKIYSAGYNGKIYPIYNVTTQITQVDNAAGYVKSNFKDSIYMSESFGTMVVDEDFLKSKFGELTYYAKAEELNPAGVFITDYVADAMIATVDYVGQDYYSLIGEYTLRKTYNNSKLYINGIINTGYKEKYKDLINKISNGEFNNITDLYGDEQYLMFKKEVYDCLGYNYSLNPNFYYAYINYHWKNVWTQCLYINGLEYKSLLDVPVLGCNIQNLDNNYRANWYYTNISPIIPEDAKYMRVQYVSFSNISFGKVVFSNGESVSLNELMFERQKWLSPSTGNVTLQSENFNNSYVSDYIEIPDGCTIDDFSSCCETTRAFCTFYDVNKKYISSYKPLNFESLPSKSVIMNYKEYNSNFGTNYNESNLDSFVPHTIQLTQYRSYDINREDQIFNETVTIVSLTKDDTNLRMSQDLIDIMAKTDTYVYALYLDGTDGIGKALNVTDKLNYNYQSNIIEGIRTMTKAIDVFVPIFELINIVICFGVILIFISFASKTIKNKMREIGILKALGTKNKSILVVFGLHIALIAIITCILSTIGYYCFIDFANQVLFESMLELVPDGYVVLKLQFISFMPNVALTNCRLILILAIISLVVPMFKIKKIKPVKIIRAHE